MKVASFFAGIGGFDLGFERAGHDVVFQCENDDYCNRILERHWPNVNRFGDVRELVEISEDRRSESVIPESELWCGGFPCKDVSVARGGPRAGLDGERSGLFYQFATLVDKNRPEIVVLENVRGLLSSNDGRDFAVILQTLESLGYAVAWRVLDSQYFGVPQSRSRLYIVGYHREPRGAGTILFEPERSGGDSSEGEKHGSKSVSPFRERFGDPSEGPVVPRISYCLSATSGRHTGTDWSRTYVTYPESVRRLTPKEYERLQGFPDGWTLPEEFDPEKKDTLDTPRYRALGNAVSVPTAKWLGNRINKYLKMKQEGEAQEYDLTPVAE